MGNYYSYYESSSSFFTPQERITWAVQRLILLNVALFAVQLLLDIPFGFSLNYFQANMPPGGKISMLLAFSPIDFLRGFLWQPLTYQFLHGGLLHLFFNMLWLFFFGPDVERALGSRQFIGFYLVCGMLGVLATYIPVLLMQTAFYVTGASGAVMGVMVGFAVLNPDRQLFLFPFPIPINARTMVFIIIGMNILNAGQDSSTSVATHFGGMAVGYVYMKLIPKIRRWRIQWGKEHRFSEGPHSEKDPIGEAVDNIFKFSDKKRR